ncbi:MAG: DUF1622 domain-containing protein [Thermomicrobiales bacterium]
MIDKEFIYGISEIIDYAGVTVIAVGAAVAIIRLIRDLVAPATSREVAYTNVRAFLGRSLLLGLELLVAGDVIKTVAVEPTLESVSVLALLVIVRTILSISIDIEVDGRFPWQAAEQELKAQELELRAKELERPHTV